LYKMLPGLYGRGRIVRSGIRGTPASAIFRILARRKPAQIQSTPAKAFVHAGFYAPMEQGHEYCNRHLLY